VKIGCAAECYVRTSTELVGLARSRHGVGAFRLTFAVFLGPPSPEAATLRVHPLVRCTSPTEYLEPAPALVRRVPPSRASTRRRRAPPMGFPSQSRRQPEESTSAGVPSPLRSALDVSHVLDGLLLPLPSRVCFTPQPRPGFALQGFSLHRSRTSSSPAAALLTFVPSPCRGRTRRQGR
jgi:hypothetical protein